MFAIIAESPALTSGPGRSHMEREPLDDKRKRLLAALDRDLELRVSEAANARDCAFDAEGRDRHAVDSGQVIANDNTGDSGTAFGRDHRDLERLGVGRQRDADPDG